MVVFDPIIYNIQSFGGVSVYFDNILKRIKNTDCKYCIVDSINKSKLARYKRCDVTSTTGVFHSSYYRLPSNPSLKVVTTVHDFTYERFIKGPSLWVHKWQKYRAIRNSDIVICVSHNTAKDLMYYCPIDPDKIRVIHNGVSESYHPLQNVNRRQKEVIFVGSRVSYKNFSLAVGAVSELPSLTLGIVGGGELSSEEKKMLETKLPGRYKVYGKLSDEDLNLCYNKAYALIYPSSYEGFGIPVIEAMKAGCPVVSVNKSSIPEVAGNAAILVDSPSVSNFAEALVSIQTQRSELILRGLEQAKKFSWDKCFSETYSVYQELMQ